MISKIHEHAHCLNNLLKDLLTQGKNVFSDDTDRPITQETMRELQLNLDLILRSIDPVYQGSKQETLLRALDITDYCPGVKAIGVRIQLYFSRIDTELYATIQETFPNKEYGFVMDVEISELESELSDTTFGDWAERLGVSTRTLKAIIEKYVPKD